jgi:hypothetical protein
MKLHGMTEGRGTQEEQEKRKKDGFTTQTNAGVILANLVSIDG